MMQSFRLDELPSRDAYRLFVSMVVPRPVAWVSTIGLDGIANLAPFSFFNAVSSQPPIVMISPSDRTGENRVKDTLRNARESGEFVVNMVDESLAEAMNRTSAEWPYEVDEWQAAGIGAAPAVDVRPPLVVGSPFSLECKTTQIVQVEGSHSTLVLGKVVRVHVREGLVRPDWLIDAERFRPIARLGGDEYTTLGRVFEMKRPRA